MKKRIIQHRDDLLADLIREEGKAQGVRLHVERSERGVFAGLLRRGPVKYRLFAYRTPTQESAARIVASFKEENPLKSFLLASSWSFRDVSSLLSVSQEAIRRYSIGYMSPNDVLAEEMVTVLGLSSSLKKEAK